MPKLSVAVVGGGIAGLSAAFDLQRAGHNVTVFEAADRWGGKIYSSPVGDRLVDAGADTFLARVEPGYQLAQDLGLAEELTTPVSPVPAYIQRDGQLHRLPQGTFLGVPTNFDLFSQTTLISPAGIKRAQQDLTLPPTDTSGDISVGAYCRARLGDEVTDRLIDPLIGGINASQIDQLSLASGAPQLAAAAKAGPSLVQELSKMQARIGATLGSASAAPVFYGLPGGIARLIGALVSELGGSGPGDADLLLGTPITNLTDLADFDHIVLATPAPATAKLLAPTSPNAAEALSLVEYASVAQVTLEIPRTGIEPVLDASGVLFPRVDGTVLTACTWFSTKWTHYQREESVLIRLSSGRFNDGRAFELDDYSLVDRLLSELKTVFKISAKPIATRVHRWHQALPQYVPGHAERVDRAIGAVAVDQPRVQLAGAAYSGIGIPACINSGRDAAARIIRMFG